MHKAPLFLAASLVWGCQQAPAAPASQPAANEVAPPAEPTAEAAPAATALAIGITYCIP